MTTNFNLKGQDNSIFSELYTDEVKFKFDKKYATHVRRKQRITDTRNKRQFCSFHRTKPANQKHID